MTITALPPARRAVPQPPRPAVVFVGAVVGLGAAAVLALWWATTPRVAGWAGLLTEAGRITGLLAGYGCAVLLALMARVPVLERGLGTDRLARWHAMGGRYVLSLACAHALLIIGGYAVSARTGSGAMAVGVVLDHPEMLKGTLGFLVLLGVGISSVRAARRALPYEAWHLMHLGAYLGIFLAFSHQLAAGAQFAAIPAARVFWYLLYGSVAAVLGWYRFVTPVRRAFRHRMRVCAVRAESPGVWSVYVGGRRLEELGARPGQFFRWRFAARGLWWAANPYSLSAAPRPDLLRITVKAAGGHSAALARLRPGTRVFAEGPYGAFTADRSRGRDVLMIAGGAGIAPLRALFETIPARAVLIYLARTPADFALRGELEAIAADRGQALHCFVDEPARCGLPLTAEALRRLVPDVASRDVYLCGPPGMAEAAGAALRAAGVPARRVHDESFEF